MRFLKLVNLPELLLLSIAMFAFKFGFLDRQMDIYPALSTWQYVILVLACVFIAAGGFFINNVFGIGKDANPAISEAKGYNIYIALTLAGVGAGYYIANYTGKPMFTGIFVIAAATLYIYATSLKQTILISNIVIACVVALPVVSIGIFNLYPVLSTTNQKALGLLFSLLLDYTIFAFTIGLVLTFVNDLTNTDADYNAGTTTLPIVLGRNRTKKIVLVFSLLPVAMLIYYIDAYLLNLTYALGFGLLFILAPLVYFLIKLWNAKTQPEFRHLETVLKLVLLFTALSIVVINLNIIYRAKG